MGSLGLVTHDTCTPKAERLAPQLTDQHQLGCIRCIPVLLDDLVALVKDTQNLTSVRYTTTQELAARLEHLEARPTCAEGGLECLWKVLDRLLGQVTRPIPQSQMKVASKKKKHSSYRIRTT